LSSSDIEKLEEAKLKAKFPNATGRPFGGHSVFLQKRLAKGVNIDNFCYRISILLNPEKYLYFLETSNLLLK
jgi:hypothetical protein